MRRWTIVLLIVVAVILVIFGGAVQLISTLLPQETQESYLVYILGFGITYALVNGIVTAMQWFGKSPLDFLPEKTLREKDPNAFGLRKPLMWIFCIRRREMPKIAKSMNGLSLSQMQ
jgi:hypothetical protein